MPPLTAREFRIPVGPAVVVALFVGCSSSHRDLEGVRLGMTSGQVRSQFSAPGTWASGTRADGTLVLEWTHQHPDDLSHATFELHEGVVVAARAEYRHGSELGDDRVESTEDDVWAIVRRPDGSAQVAWIARNCPVHRDEVTRLDELGSQALLVPAAVVE